MTEIEHLDWSIVMPLRLGQTSLVIGNTNFFRIGMHTYSKSMGLSDTFGYITFAVRIPSLN